MFLCRGAQPTCMCARRKRAEYLRTSSSSCSTAEIDSAETGRAVPPVLGSQRCRVRCCCCSTGLWWLGMPAAAAAAELPDGGGGVGGTCNSRTRSSKTCKRSRLKFVVSLAVYLLCSSPKQHQQPCPQYLEPCQHQCVWHTPQYSHATACWALCCCAAMSGQEKEAAFVLW